MHDHEIHRQKCEARRFGELPPRYRVAHQPRRGDTGEEREPDRRDQRDGPEREPAREAGPEQDGEG